MYWKLRTGRGGHVDGDVFLPLVQQDASLRVLRDRQGVLSEGGDTTQDHPMFQNDRERCQLAGVFGFALAFRHARRLLGWTRGYLATCVQLGHPDENVRESCLKQVRGDYERHLVLRSRLDPDCAALAKRSCFTEVAVQQTVQKLILDKWNITERIQKSERHCKNGILCSLAPEDMFQRMGAAASSGRHHKMSDVRRHTRTTSIEQIY